ncbi:PKS-NRPS hybrid synthetase CHGG_01239-like [Olea europaea var. sylvestris]|uniref:PKS-NRPS hybrid synthetase CHGG_01239-like n=1 Tax=Olea europaea var. sylvestris TaxID=158386 RepID=UPI000C1D29FE|nr:PKS-NRPS hybrid synthetase CHGG_01239-like [Olea europaea var. sylvestris]
MGSAEESYAKLARYCHNMKKTNPDSEFFIETEGGNCFKFFFMALEQCIRRFRNVMRPIIIVDGRTLNSKYQGKLIITTCQDANIQIYPLAFGIVDSENDMSMRWFFTKLREVIEKVEDLAFVIDREQPLINSMAEVFPDAHHGYCMYHIQGNLKTRMSIQHITSNNAESFNALFKKDRELLILALIENICTKLQQWFHDQHVELQNCTSVLAPAQEERLFKAAELPKQLNVEPLDELRFSVECALAVAMYRGFAARILCSHYYTSNYLRVAYAKTIFPLPNEVEWEILDHIRPLNILLSPFIEPHGSKRSSTSRIPSTGEFPRPCRYNWCKSIGHTR